MSHATSPTLHNQSLAHLHKLAVLNLDAAVSYNAAAMRLDDEPLVRHCRRISRHRRTRAQRLERLLSAAGMNGDVRANGDHDVTWAGWRAAHPDASQRVPLRRALSGERALTEAYDDAMRAVTDDRVCELLRQQRDEVLQEAGELAVLRRRRFA